MGKYIRILTVQNTFMRNLMKKNQIMIYYYLIIIRNMNIKE